MYVKLNYGRTEGMGCDVLPNQFIEIRLIYLFRSML